MPADEDAAGPLDDLTPWLGRSGRLVTSPARRCRQPGGEVEPLLRPWDLGAWVGRPLDELDLTAWRSDPGYEAHGGESLLALLDRVRDLLEKWQDQEGRLVAVTHAAVIKAAVVNVLRAQPTAVWDIDVHPGCGTELHFGPGGWRVVRVNTGLGP